MKHIIISIKIRSSLDGKPVALEEMNVTELKQLRFRLLVEAGKIKNRIYELTGEELP